MVYPVLTSDIEIFQSNRARNENGESDNSMTKSPGFLFVFGARDAFVVKHLNYSTV